MNSPSRRKSVQPISIMNKLADRNKLYNNKTKTDIEDTIGDNYLE